MSKMELENKEMLKMKCDALALLKALIATPSPSKQENKTACLLQSWLNDKGVDATLIGNNVCAKNKFFDTYKPSILLVSHHDTVPPSKDYTIDPYTPFIKEGKLYGLGSNDAGGPLVSLLSAFVYFYDEEHLPFNLMFCAAAEEEISGRNGLELALPFFGEINFAIVGEPTSMALAISEKGLMVCDCIAYGKSGHTARDEGENAILKAIKDIQWLTNYKFDKVSPSLGEIKMSATMIEAGIKHNIVPNKCHFVVDVRTTDAYSNEEVLKIMQQNMQSEVQARSTRIKPSATPLNHPVVKALLAQGVTTYGSPTTSDQAILSCPSVKFSPGDSARSHTANEFIYIQQINEGIAFFIDFFSTMRNMKW